MATDFKLSATLRGHEEDVSISTSSCDLSILHLGRSLLYEVFGDRIEFTF